jgi:hypothetical protein
MRLVEVTTRKHRREFLLLPVRLYRNDPNWIRPLDKDIEAVFDPAKNKFFKHGECTRWLLKDDAGEVIGRVAAFVNRKTAGQGDYPVGGMGFFDCIDDRGAAFTLFDQCKAWLAARGMEAMEGPVNFGERDSFWGLLVDGFTPVPYKMNYNPPGYRAFFESYGFRNYFEQWCYTLTVADRLQDKFYSRHRALADAGEYRAEHLKKSRLDQYADDFRTVYNKAWARHGGGKALEQKAVRAFFRKMKPVMDEQIVWYAYRGEEPVAVWVSLPDINQLFRRFDGKLNLWNKIRFMILLKRRVCRKFIGLVFGVVPEHQSKGVDSFLIVEGARHIQRKNLYEYYEMQWIGDFNPKMVAICESLGTVRSRTLITYRFLFDPQREFKRHPVLA